MISSWIIWVGPNFNDRNSYEIEKKGHHTQRGRGNVTSETEQSDQPQVKEHLKPAHLDYKLLASRTGKYICAVNHFVGIGYSSWRKLKQLVTWT